VTGRRLLHLAELASEAAEFTRAQRPAWARSLDQAAHIALLAAQRQTRAERVRELRAAVAAIEAASN
jgi:hypothetical protein